MQMHEKLEVGKPAQSTNLLSMRIRPPRASSQNCNLRQGLVGKYGEHAPVMGAGQEMRKRPAGRATAANR